MIDDNYTKIPNDFLDSLINANLNGTEKSIVLFVLRKTIGFNKQKDMISISQFEKACRVSRPAICKAIKSLQLVNILLLVNKSLLVDRSKTDCNNWELELNVKRWQLVNKSLLVNKTNLASKQNDKQLVNKSLHTKDILTKETLQKKKVEFSPEVENLYNFFIKTYSEKIGDHFKIPTGRNKTSWKNDLRLMIENDKHDIKLIEKLIELAAIEYDNSLNGVRYSFVIISTKSFREKFTKLHDKWIQNNNSNNNQIKTLSTFERLSQNKQEYDIEIKAEK